VWSSLLTTAGRSLSGRRGNAIAHGSDGGDTLRSRIQPSAMFEFSALSSRPGPLTGKHRALSDPCFQKLPLSRLQQKALVTLRVIGPRFKFPKANLPLSTGVEVDRGKLSYCEIQAESVIHVSGIPNI